MVFNVKKAAQLVAFLAREQGGSIDLITVVKMAYLADRKFMELHDFPILNDELYSMEHGPVDSNTYNYVKGQGKHREVWEKYLKTQKDKNMVYVSRKLADEDFDELSRAEIKVLREIAHNFANYGPFELVDYVHKHCSEWEDVGKSSKPLSYERVFNALGKKNSNKLADRIYEFGNLEEALVKAK